MKVDNSHSKGGADNSFEA